ncbi:MAG: hypothetical protein ABFD76_10075 [Smithella sp.]
MKKPSITQKIKSFEDACKHLGIETKLPEVGGLYPYHQKGIIAFYKLSVIATALNEGWKPDWSDRNQRKWFPWWYVSTDRSSAGLACAHTAYTAASPNAYYGSRLGFKTEALARYAADQFKDLYEDMLLYN